MTMIYVSVMTRLFLFVDDNLSPYNYHYKIFIANFSFRALHIAYSFEKNIDF